MKIQMIATLLAITAITVSCGKDSEFVKLDNGLLSIEFDRSNGSVRSFAAKGMSEEEMMDRSFKSQAMLWQLLDSDGNNVEDTTGMRFMIQKEGRSKASMKWELSDGATVTAKVKLGKTEALSYWSISVDGVSGKGITHVRFPIVGGFTKMPEERLAVSDWQGTLYSDLRSSLDEKHPTKTYSWSMAGKLTMQLIALYGNGCPGLYISSNDVEAQTKVYNLVVDNEHTTISMDLEYPEDHGLDTLNPGYETVLGAFEGDWHEAAAIYRRWAVEQPWCRDSRFHNGLTADWAQNTAAWIWNRNSADNVLPEAEDLSDYLGGLPVSVLWHWWHGCPYDDGFPDYIPPRDGAERFTEALDKAAERDIHAIVYMNSIQWGNSTESYVREGADSYKALRRDGGDYSHAFNVFTGHALTPMCMATDFWRQKYAALCDTVVNRYHAAGVYMDQACMSYRCYNPEHGHPVGGGNYWMKGFEKLESLIREKTGNPVLGGEGSGEVWMPYLDLFLTLEASRERYMGVSETVRTIPLYQAVYHDYAICFGSYSSLVYPPYDDLWPDEYRPANKETELPEEFNLQFRMEQARGFVWGTQPMIANYHAFLRQTRPSELEYFRRLVQTRANAPEYLGRGVCSRSPHIVSPTVQVPVSRISIYAGRWGSQVTSGMVSSPLIYSEGWKSDKGTYAVALTNISDDSLPITFNINPADYGVRGRYNVNLITSAGRKAYSSHNKGNTTFSGTIEGKDAFLIEFVPAR